MSQDDIKKVASGRVWTGEQALDKGLVDILGSFDDAVKIAAGKAGLGDDYKVKYYPKTRSFFERLMSDYDDNVRISALKEATGEYYIFFNQWERVKNYQGIQTRMPAEFIIH
jgi:protease-4